MAHALDLVGERWALLVVRELLLGPKRFSNLRAGLPGISPNVLTQRLQELEEAGIVVRRRLPPPASVPVYDLSDWGRELEPAVRAIGRWAARSPCLPRGRHMSVNSVVLSLRTMFDADKAKGFCAALGLVLDGQRFRAEIADGRIDLALGGTENVDVIVSGGPDDLAGVVYGGVPLAESGLTIDGDAAVLDRFLTLFPLPEAADLIRPALTD